jgi:branched-chain amino acid aminotransferase
VLVTPPVSETILNGITRESLLVLAKDMGIVAIEKPVSIEQLKLAFKQGTITEAFGVGTAAVVAPIGLINIEGRDHEFPAYDSSRICYRLKEKTERIRTGKDFDKYGWNYVV